MYFIDQTFQAVNWFMLLTNGKRNRGKHCKIKKADPFISFNFFYVFYMRTYDH